MRAGRRHSTHKRAILGVGPVPGDPAPVPPAEGLPPGRSLPFYLDRESVEEISVRIERKKQRRKVLRARMSAAAWATANRATRLPQNLADGHAADASETLANDAVNTAHSAVGGAKRAKASLDRARRILDEGRPEGSGPRRSILPRPARSRRRTRLAPQKARIVLRVRIPKPIMAVRRAWAALAATAAAKLAPALYAYRRLKRLALIALIALISLPLLGMVVMPIIAAPAAIQAGSGASLDGLPAWITVDVVLEALRCQEEYGHPAGATLAQIIAESGGSEPSLLASRDHNLFGMKWSSSFAGEPEVVGSSSWRTEEEYGGDRVTITAGFTVFKSDRDCVRFRSRVFLQMSHYADNPLIREGIEKRSSDIFCEGLKDAGWATASEYVAFLKSIMDTYDLRRFDSMTAAGLLQTLQSGTSAPGGVHGSVADGPIGARQAAVIRYADASMTPSPGAGYCAAWVTMVFANAGIGVFPGNACDMYWEYCTSSDRADLRPGMIIAVPTEPYSEAAVIYGHVGIYVGDGLVAQNVSGRVGYQDLEDWISEFGVTSTPRWGWLGNVALA